MKRESLRPIVRWLLGVGLAALAGASEAQAQAAAPMDPRLMAQIQTLLDEKAARTPAQRKLDAQLVLGMKKRRGDPMFARLPEMGAPLEMRGDRTRVDLRGEITPALENAVRRLGGDIVGSYPEISELQAWVPVARLETLAARPDVQSIRAAARAITRVTTQGDVAHGTSALRMAFPEFDGRGVKVCVLSDGVFDLPNRQAAGELPAVEIIGERFVGDPAPQLRTEGTAMLEIIHDIAPGASLGFATALPSIGAFMRNIRALRSRGCQILVDDIGFDIEPAFQDGALEIAIDDVVRDGALYFSAAGNTGRAGQGRGSVWEGDFKGVLMQTLRGAMIVNDFGNGTTPVTVNALLSGAPSIYTLKWADPFFAPVSDYDMFLLNASRTMILRSSTTVQLEGGVRIAVEELPTEGLNQTGVSVMVALAAGSPRAIHFEAFGGSGARISISTGGHIIGHPAALGADAVAAVAASADPNAPFAAGVESFSSEGRRRIFFSPNGAPLTPGNFLFATNGGQVRDKPDLTAADRVSTSTPGFLTFTGTSAAAPHAAAIAAVLKSAAPTVPSDRLRLVLKETARDIGTPGFDTLSGNGIVDALNALPVVMAGVPCFDGIDNDGDGGVDFPGDVGCAKRSSATESPACSDGSDNDFDGLVDLADAECRSPAGTSECGGGAAQSLAILPLLAYFARRRHRDRPAA